MSSKRAAWSWILYDSANSAFGSIVVTAYYILYFKNVVIGEAHRGDFVWGKMVGLSMLLLALLSPVLGAIADRGRYRKELLVGFTLLAIAATAGLALAPPSIPALSIAFFCLALIGYEAGITFYDSFLHDVSSGRAMGRVSGLGFGFGYLGGIVSIAVSYPFIARGDWSLAPLWIVVAQFTLLSLPCFFFVREPADAKPALPLRDNVREGLRDFCGTLADLKHYPELALFLVAYLFFYDGLATVISFGGAFAKDTLGFETKEIFLVFILSNVVAVPGSFLGGWLTDRIGGKKTILATLVLWMATILALALSQSKAAFYVVTSLVGIGLGSTQGAARAFFAAMVPKEREARFFALKGLCGRAGTVLGPIVFGAVSYFTANQRLAALTLLFFFAVGFVLVLRVDDARGRARVAP